MINIYQSCCLNCDYVKDDSSLGPMLALAASLSLYGVSDLVDEPKDTEVAWQWYPWSFCEWPVVKLVLHSVLRAEGTSVFSSASTCYVFGNLPASKKLPESCVTGPTTK